MTFLRLVLEEINFFSFFLQNSHILRIACFIICTSCKRQGAEKTSLTPTGVRNIKIGGKTMATFHMANHSYEINSYADLASVRAQLEELHRQKRVTDNTYEIKMKELDRFSHNHHLSK